MNAKITRTEIVIIDTVSHNSYNDLLFTDKSGKEYKIGAKRAPFFEKTIVANMGVELSYAMSSFGKEYVYSAKQVKDILPPPAQWPAQPVQPPPPKTDSSKKVDSEEIKIRSMAAAYAKDLVVAGKIEVKELLSYCEFFRCYMMGKNVEAEARRLGQ